MPIHNYKCKKCKHEYEVFYTTQSAVEKEEADEQCPKCESKQKERQFPKGTSFILKGKGWARDNYD